MTWLAIGVGGALGSMARHAVNAAIARMVGTAVPYATLTVNVVGCLVIGLLAGALASERLHLSPVVRAFVFVGVLGGFTTFSTLGLDTFTLTPAGASATALWNVAAQVGVGMGAVYVGYALTT